MITEVMILIGVATAVLMVFVRQAFRSTRVSLDKSAVSDYWLAQHRRLPDENDG